jgi:hypothetical protein
MQVDLAVQTKYQARVKFGFIHGARCERKLNRKFWPTQKRCARIMWRSWFLSQQVGITLRGMQVYFSELIQLKGMLNFVNRDSLIRDFSLGPNVSFVAGPFWALKGYLNR